MDEAEQRQILEEIARDTDNYPRDRIAAVRALRAMGTEEQEDFEDAFDRILAKAEDGSDPTHS